MYITSRLILFVFVASVLCREHGNDRNPLEKIKTLEKEQESLRRRVEDLEEKVNGALASATSLDETLQDDGRTNLRIKRHVSHRRKYSLSNYVFILYCI